MAGVTVEQPAPQDSGRNLPGPFDNPAYAGDQAFAGDAYAGDPGYAGPAAYADNPAYAEAQPQGRPGTGASNYRTNKLAEQIEKGDLVDPEELARQEAILQ